MTPDSLLEDLMERLAALDVDELIAFDEAWTFWQADAETSDAAKRFFGALHEALRSESRRRRGTGETYRLDRVREVVATMPSRDIDDAIHAFGEGLRRGPEVGLTSATLAMYEVAQRLLFVERLERRATDRLGRRLMNDGGEGCSGWWGKSPGTVAGQE